MKTDPKTSQTSESETPVDGTTNESGDDESLGINFFDQFSAEEGDEASSPDDGVEAGGGEDAGAAPAGGEAAAAPPAPGEQKTQEPATTPTTAGKDETPAPVTPPQAPAAQQQPAAAKPGEQQQTPAQQPQDQQQAPPAGNETQSGDMLANVRAEVDKNRQVYSDLLVEKVYGMSEDDAKALFETPEKVLPQLAAKVHLEVVQNVLGTLAQILPAQIAAVQQAQVQNNSLLDDFWNSHPTLDRNTDHATVVQLAQMFRAQNPNASFEDFKRMVGAQAMVALNKLPVAAPAAGSAPAPAPARLPAHRPAAQGGPPLAPKGGSQTAEDYWGGFSQMLDEG